ncbi:unnamed protein product [Rotaria socialis]|uniref:Uncharacterized protein n=1 Tax=Rotaria socialis TaxID=392032 RepID=A0A821LZ45_9BILA|nr:unnamed protein product [Rotaria socialis]
MASSSTHLTEDTENSNMPIVHENTHNFTIVWFYTGIELDDNRKILMDLQFNIGNVQTCNQCELCSEYIKSIEFKEVILIITVKHGSEIVPSLHDLRQLHSIYIYNLSDLSEQRWIYCYPKVSYHLILFAMNLDVVAIPNFCNCTTL